MSTTDYISPPTVEHLYLDHHHWLQGWLRRRLDNTAEAADLAHDTFVRLIRSPQRFDSQPQAGIKGAYLGGALNASLAVFRIDQENRALQDPAVPCASAAVANHCYRAEGKVRSQGIEAEVTGRLLPQLDVFAGYTLNTTKYLKDSSNQGLAFRPQTPRHLIKLWAQYRMPWDGGRWSLGGGINAQSSYYALNGAVRSDQRAYAVAAMRVGYQLSKQVQLVLSVNNLFDKVYYSGIRGVDFGNVYGEPRNVMLTAKASF